MVKFLIDENLSPQIAIYLRELGYDTKAVREAGLIGKTDGEIIVWVKANRATIITRDLGFGYTYAMKDPSFGLILLRSKIDSVDAFQKILQRLHESGYLARISTDFIVATVRTVRIFKNRSEREK